MPDNLDIVPAKFVLNSQGLLHDTRTYRCRTCGWKTPPVKNGEELREAVQQGHLCFPRR